MGSWQKKMRKARRLHRPSLKNWERDGLFDSFPAYVRDISEQENYQSIVFADVDPISGGAGAAEAQPQDDDGDEENNGKSNGGGSRSSSSSTGTTVASSSLPVVLDARYISIQDFHMQYEAKEIPCILRNIPSGYYGGAGVPRGPEWPAIKQWTLQALEQDDVMAEETFKCGEDDDGSSVRVKLKHFLNYLHDNRDDSPLYIFDSANFDGEDELAERILSCYDVPGFFKDDLFRYVSEARRPPYRWFLCGPERSGTTVHIDPLNTHAWNTLLHGQKRWVLFPPHVPKSIVKGRGLVGKHEDDEAVHYFTVILPRIKRRAAKMRHNNHHDNDDYRAFACYEFTQHAGETIFVPAGWWHAVLNLTHTVGVTQNFCSPRNFDKVWLAARQDRKRMAWKWLQTLKERRPELAARALKLNQRDNFRMKYDPVEIAQREKEEEKARYWRRQYSKKP